MYVAKTKALINCVMPLFSRMQKASFHMPQLITGKTICSMYISLKLKLKGNEYKEHKVTLLKFILSTLIQYINSTLN